MTMSLRKRLNDAFDESIKNEPPITFKGMLEGLEQGLREFFGGLLVLAIIGGILYVIGHFVVKYW